MSEDIGAASDEDRAVVNGAGQAVSALRASVPSADPVNYAAWARNAVAFIREQNLEPAFRDWCGGWPAPASVACADELLLAGREMAVALHGFVLAGCPVCNGDCASANPPVVGCPIQASDRAVRRWNQAQAIESRRSTK